LENSNLEKEKFKAHPIDFLKDLLKLDSTEKNQGSTEEASEDGFV